MTIDHDDWFFGDLMITQMFEHGALVIRGELANRAIIAMSVLGAISDMAIDVLVEHGRALGDVSAEHALARG